MLAVAFELRHAADGDDAGEGERRGGPGAESALTRSQTRHSIDRHEDERVLAMATLEERHRGWPIDVGSGLDPPRAQFSTG